MFESLVEFYSEKTNETFIVLMGGLSYFVDGGPDAEIPFDNTVTTVRMNPDGSFEQFLMNNSYPVILSPFGEIGQPLLFGTDAQFFPVKQLPFYSNGVIALDKLKGSPILLGYIVGGVASSAPNTFSMTDSASSTYIFEVYLNLQ